MSKEKNLTQNWVVRDKMLQCYSQKTNIENFYLYDINEHKPCFMSQVIPKNCVNITPFLCVGLSILVHNSIYNEKNSKALQTLNELYKQNYFKNSKELYSFLNYFNNFNGLEIESKKVLYITFLLHQTKPMLMEEEIKKTISFLLVQYCLDKNRFVSICADLFNSIWSDLPKLFYSYSNSLDKEKDFVFDYDIPTSNKKANLLNEQKLCEILTLRVLLDYFTYEDKVLNEQELEIRKTVKDNSKTIIDSCIEITTTDIISLTNMYIKGKLGKYGCGADNLEFICNSQTDLFKVYGLLSIYKQPQYYSSNKGTLDKEVYEEIMYIEHLYNNRVRCKHTRIVQYNDLISNLMTLPSTISLLNVEPIVENNNVKELETTISELTRQLNLAKTRIKELEKEQTVSQLECSELLSNKDYIINQKVSQIETQYKEIETLKQANKLLSSQIDILITDEEETEINSEITLEDKVKYLNQFKVILICGRFDLIAKLNALGWDNVTQHDSYEDYGSFDYACIQTRFCSHSHTERFRAYGETNRQNTFYFNGTNPTLLINSCYEYIYNAENVERENS